MLLSVHSNPFLGVTIQEWEEWMRMKNEENENTGLQHNTHCHSLNGVPLDKQI